MSDAERLAERLEALLAKATPPVWIADGKDIVHADGPQAWGKKEVANVALIVEAVNALPTLLARIAALEEALGEIEEGKIERPILWTYREDGKPSKHDRCIHDVWMYETCAGCIDAHIAKALGKGSE